MRIWILLYSIVLWIEDLLRADRAGIKQAMSVERQLSSNVAESMVYSAVK